MTLGLPPAGRFWQPAGGSPSPNSLPSLLRSFVPCSCSAHLGAVRVRKARREGTGGPASAPSRPPCPPPASPLLRPSPAPSSRGGPDRAPAAVTRPSRRRPTSETRFFLPAARSPPASLAGRRSHQPSAPGLSLWAFLPGAGEGCFWLRNCQPMGKKRTPLLAPRED